MDYDSVLQLVMKRRSIRNFKPEPIPDEYVEKIIEVARFAPSAANCQPWEFVVVKEKQLKDEMVDIVKEASVSTYKIGQTRPPEERHPSDNRVAEHPGFRDAPVFIVLFGDRRLVEALPLSAYLHAGENGLISSLANTFLYMHLAATSLGLASQWVTATAQPLPQALIKELLGVPRDYRLYDTMAVGYGVESPRPRLVRNRDELIHYDRYDMSRYRTNDQVKKFIRTLHEGRTATRA